MEQDIFHSQRLIEMTSSPPRRLDLIQAELLFIDDTYLFHYRENGQETYKYLSPESLQEAFNNQPFDSDWLPSGILRHGSSCHGTWAVLFIPAQRHSLDFGEEQLSLPLPSLIFMGHHQSYWLWAIADQLFSPQAQAFYAPLPNVNTSPCGRICWGQNSPPVANLQTLPEAWKLFISSQFTTHYTNHKSKMFPNDIIRQLKDVHCGDRYPLSDLIPIGVNETIESLIQAVLQSIHG